MFTAILLQIQFQLDITTWMIRLRNAPRNDKIPILYRKDPEEIKRSALPLAMYNDAQLLERKEELQNALNRLLAQIHIDDV